MSDLIDYNNKLTKIFNDIIALKDLQIQWCELVYGGIGTEDDLWRKSKPFGIEKPVTKTDFYNQFPTPADFYASIEWKKKRIEILKRDGYRCYICKRKPATTVHHLNSAYYNPEMALDDENLIVLCGMCHNKWNRDRDMMSHD